MKLFKPLYEKALQWAAHPQAERLLAGLSFVEAIIFPVMPEVMLAPMTLARPSRWARYATISMVFSVIGAVVGYVLGHYAFDLLRPLLDYLGWLPRIDALVLELRTTVANSAWTAFWLLVLAGFMPVPLKIFTWASGIVGVPMLAFVASMIIGRGKRVYLLAGVIRLGGPRAEAVLHKYIEWVGWAALLLFAGLILWLKLRH
ncbi:membrane protein YqaA with SNARE-associated domain [Tahibacter aquaticus]|uniref:Membrane protein YqaA with SNARE-associated domain n=1 Tax=Tahibacter aquaticus TaxID=520092 RepID=A0A4R6YP26_9GAMM|nr:YqaA family protein [Tahibacter aquaticus]TDR39433.1 membrane protein YqaA with SNARE-associated domain [Tahibacter aquaticus]